MAWGDDQPLVVNLTTFAAKYEALYNGMPDNQTPMKPGSINAEPDPTDPWVVILTADYDESTDDPFRARTWVRLAPDGSWDAEGNEIMESSE